jgi:crotonobetainyl-CoA:carnitine CoA-transferase CaiB-like acyl-CoA transferase
VLELDLFEKYPLNSLRVANRDDVDAQIQQRLEKEPFEVWMKRFEEAKIPYGPINDLKSVFEDPHIKERQLVQHVEHPVAGAIPLLSPPVRFDSNQSEIRFPPPLLGEHTNEVLEKELGLSKAEIDRLRTEGAVK